MSRKFTQHQTGLTVSFQQTKIILDNYENGLSGIPAPMYIQTYQTIISLTTHRWIP